MDLHYSRQNRKLKPIDESRTDSNHVFRIDRLFLRAMPAAKFCCEPPVVLHTKYSCANSIFRFKPSRVASKFNTDLHARWAILRSVHNPITFRFKIGRQTIDSRMGPSTSIIRQMATTAKPTFIRLTQVKLQCT